MHKRVGDQKKTIRPLFSILRCQFPDRKAGFILIPPSLVLGVLLVFNIPMSVSDLYPSIVWV